MDNKRHNPDTNEPETGEPLDDLGQRGKLWSPGQEHGISNRPGDEEPVGQADDDDEYEDDEDSEQEDEDEGENGG